MLALIAILGAGYAARVWFQNNIVSVVSGGRSSDCLEMAGSTTTEEEGATFIVGSIKNNCDHGFAQVTILFNVDRAPGAFGDLPEGVAYAYSRDVKAGEIRDFKTAVPISKNSTYRFQGINAY